MYASIQAEQPVKHFAGSTAAVGAWPQDPNQKNGSKMFQNLESLTPDDERRNFGGDGQ
jgi:hypothetical protein